VLQKKPSHSKYPITASPEGLEVRTALIKKATWDEAIILRSPAGSLLMSNYTRTPLIRVYS